MIGVRELFTYVYGVWRLARLDADGIHAFPNTVPAFWRSFQAAVFVAPFIVVTGLDQMSRLQTSSSTGFIITVFTLIYAISWLLFPVIVLYLAEALQRRDRFLRYIAAHNWSAVIRQFVPFVVVLVGETGILPRGLITFMLVATEIAILVYMGYIARVGLEISIPASIAIVVLYFITNYLLMLIALSMIRVSGIQGP